ncbi:MAG: hypothetical protein EXQ91_02565 [Alphaproteobacteria bacterium]|nr:hypothetical protein [Alphaproteobacteria bacterium]
MAVMEGLLDEADLGPARPRIEVAARRLVEAVRGGLDRAWTLEAFLQEYRQSTQEGVVLMCLAEALLRIPDAETQDKLIRDKLQDADWERHLRRSRSLFVNASTWGLMLTVHLIEVDERLLGVGFLDRLAMKVGEQIVREALTQAVRILSSQFVMGRTIGEALERARTAEHSAVRHSYDMLGESALTEAGARRYCAAYATAIAAVGSAAPGHSNTVLERPGVSIKLSGLHPRFKYAQRDDVLARLVPRLKEFLLEAKRLNLLVTIDGEEANRLDLMLDVFESTFRDPAFGGWDGFGLAVQAYQNAPAPSLIGWRPWLVRPAAVFRSSSSKVRTGIPRSSESKRAASTATRCSPASL